MKSEIYETFMKEYHINHEVCPKCGTKPHSTTLAGYIFNSSKPEEYKDLNRCSCVNCGDVHTYHERISLNKFIECFPPKKTFDKTKFSPGY